MLFNSYEFIFAFLPIVLWVYERLHRRSITSIIWLVVASWFFYAWWNPKYLPLLLGSIAFNFIIGKRLSSSPSRGLLAGGIAANLALLAYFKYAEFFVSTSNQVFGTAWDIGIIVLPLAISFFTFQQIAYLVDSHQGKTQEYRFFDYALFVSYFPQLIAGPIVHHAEMMPQFRVPRTRQQEDLAVGLTIFSIGLFKKAVLADGIAPYADNLFDSATSGASPTMIHAWLGTICYAMQIYFDFSGYSDMAIGAARMAGIRLPLNFFAPYKAVTISDFWRRWHVTLSRFLRDYLYIPLGGNRHGKVRRYVNLIVTMLLGGLWHGAGWTFVIWGLLHGGYLCMQHAWSAATKPWQTFKTRRTYQVLAIFVTFLFVNVAWVYFRSPTVEVANRVTAGMFCLNGVSLPRAVSGKLLQAGLALDQLGIEADDESGSRFTKAVLWVASLAVIVWCLPTTQELMSRFKPTVENPADYRSVASHSSIRWQPEFIWAVFVSILFTAGILAIPEVSEFLYFQF